MHSFRQKHLRQRVLAVVMLLGLLLQVQTVLACQMLEIEMEVVTNDHHAMSHSSSHSSAHLDPAHLDHTYLDPGHLGHGPDCCCGDLAVSDRYAVTHAEAPVQDCCYVSSELTLKQGDPQSEPFMLAPKPSNQELPEAALVLILAALWPDELFAQQPAGARHLYADRSAPGTKTYLSTQRLRI